MPGSSPGMTGTSGRADLAEELRHLVAELLALDFQGLRGDLDVLGGGGRGVRIGFDARDVVGDVLGAVRGITATIGKISQIAGAIAAAVQEQGTATQEIASNVQHVSADTLSGQAETLRGHVDGLLAAMRAA